MANLMGQVSVDLFRTVHLPEIENAVLDAMRSGQIASGSKVAELENAFSDQVGRKFIVSTNNLTSAVTLALHLAGVCAGDNVATVSFCCLQSSAPIALLKASPVWIDLNPTTMSMSVEDLSVKLDSSIKAVLLYHIAGYPAEADKISSLCRAHEIPLIEDCNNAIGATLYGKPAGVYGEYAVYSIYPNRQINGFDGGMLATPDLEVTVRATHLRRFGINSENFRDSRGEINPDSDISEIGWSSALSNLNATAALSQFETLAGRLSRTQEIAKRLTCELNTLTYLRPVQPVTGSVPAFWVFLILSEYRDELMEYLRHHRISSSILHQRNDVYSGFNSLNCDLPGTTIIMSQALALPCGWWLSNSEVDYVIEKLRLFSPLERA